MEPRIYRNFINGEWVESSSGQTIENRNPANRNDLIGIFQRSNAKDVDDAVAAAKSAYKSWRLTPAPKRAEILFRAADLIEKRKEEYSRDMTREMGKVLKEARGDVQEAIDMCFLMGGEGRRLFGHTTPSELPDKFAMCTRDPIGVCGMITPWNFPMAIPSWKMSAALVCGNTVVLKPAQDTPLSAFNFVKVLEEAGAPRGVVNMVVGDGRVTGTHLTKHPDVPVISFTGSTEVGRFVSESGAPSFKHIHLEMGGKNVIIILEDADVDLAVDGALWGGFGTSGQRCTAASRVVVHKKVVREFMNKFVARAKKLKIGDGIDPSVDVGPVINGSQLETIQKYVAIGKDEGATLMCGGARLESGEYKNGYFHEPTIFADVDPKMRIASEEIFGPVVSVIACNDLEHAIEIGNGVTYGLSSAIYTKDVNRAFQAMRDMNTGIFYVNSSTIGAEVHLPFGGNKATGNGHREAGVAAIDFFSEWKSIYVDYSGKLQKAQGID